MKIPKIYSSAKPADATRLALQAAAIAIGEQEQVSRSLMIALLSILRDDKENAFKEIGEIRKSLDEVEKYRSQVWDLAQVLRSED